MRSKIAKQIQDETPAAVKIFVKKYAEIVMRVHQLLREQGLTQKDLAERMEKTPSEISKWLGGNHNLTLRSIARLEAELDADIIRVPRKDAFRAHGKVSISASVPVQKPVSGGIEFQILIRPDDHQIHIPRAS